MTDRNSETASNAGVATRLVDIARGVSQVVPGGTYLREQIHGVESAALSRLKERLEQMDNAGSSQVYSTVTAASGSNTAALSLADRYQLLMDRSMNQTPESALEAFYQQLLQELVPDEARLLNVATGGHRIAISHLELSTRKGPAGRALAYLSRAGNEAGVMRNELTPLYLQHLQSMGLLDLGPEDSESGNKYEMLENESIVRKTMDKIGKDRTYKAKLVRESLVLSSLGEAFLAACNGESGS